VATLDVVVRAYPVFCHTQASPSCFSKPFIISSNNLASDVPSDAEVTHTAKIRGGVVGALLVCLLSGLFLAPHLSHALGDRLHSWRWNKGTRSRLSSRMDSLPNLFFWAWERPEDLRFLAHKNAGVAFLAKTIYIFAPQEDPRRDAGGSIRIRPRLQTLRVAPGTPLIAVVRIETRGGRQPAAYFLADTRFSRHAAYTALQQQRVAAEIVDVASLPNVRAVQVDFDATVSERAFYSALLSDVRAKLPSSIPLSITALASWCIGDPWLEQLPPGTIDEAVPMLFRMGPDTANVAKFLRSGNKFAVPACQSSLGLSTDEPLSRALLVADFVPGTGATRSKRIYIFAPRAWTQSAADAVLQEWQP
jgi:Protein of unknown function (DUF3142)